MIVDFMIDNCRRGAVFVIDAGLMVKDVMANGKRSKKKDFIFVLAMRIDHSYSYYFSSNERQSVLSVPVPFSN